ncbi:MAG: MATE family efflux transporter [Fimbriiglobus sp.]|jgi:MATE family multidrug resistance protein|nr:MATE family efflux transporter [Fimbriiglobus sp.]
MPNDDPLPANSPEVGHSHPVPGGFRELLQLAVPLVLSAGFLTLQLSLDRIFLTWNGNDEAAASMSAVMLFSTLFGLLQHTAQYTSVFVSQYLGAGRPERVGPVLWQAFRMTAIGGCLFLLLVPAVGPIAWVFETIGHAPEVARLEAEYFCSLCLSAPAAAVVAVVNAFYSGRGKTWAVLVVNAVGLGVNAPLAYAWILGEWGFPRLGPAGAGYATACGAAAAAVFGLGLLLPRRFETEFRIRSGWRLDAPLLRRMLRFGLPNGLMHAVDMTAWTVFVFLTGLMSKLEAAATTVAFTINLVAFLPLVGIGQGVEILVGRRQGEGRPDRSEQTTWAGMKLNLGYALAVSVLYAVVPWVFTWPFGVWAKDEEWSQLQPVVQTLLLFVAVYTVGDAVNVTVNYALRGAGDTRFVALLAVGLAWPVMVLPTVLAARLGWGIYGAWVAASAYIFALAVAFLIRFRGGKWRSMRVIEANVVGE